MGEKNKNNYTPEPIKRKYYLIKGYVFEEISGRRTVGKFIEFKANVYRANKEGNELLGVKLKENVTASVPDNTPYIEF